MAQRHQLGHDADRDFFRAHRADVEPDRREHALERETPAPFRAHALQQPKHLALTAHEPDVAARCAAPQPRARLRRADDRES